MAAKFKYGVKGEDGSEDGTETGTEAGDWIARLAGDDELHGGGGADTRSVYKPVNLSDGRSLQPRYVE